MKHIAIWDEDLEYAGCLASALNKRAKGKWLAMAAKEKQEWESFIRQEGTALAFVSEKYAEHINSSNCKVIMIGNQSVSGKCILRYTVQEFMYYVEREIYGAVHNIAKKGMRRIAVIPVLDRTSCRDKVRNMCKGEGKVYWEMSAFSDLELMEQGVEQILYGIKMREEAFAEMFRNQLVRYMDTWALPAAVSFLDIRELTVEDVQWFFEQLEGLGYEEIFVYMDMSGVNELSLFSLFSNIYLIQEEAAAYHTREQSILRLLNLAKCEDRIQVIK